MNAFCDRTVLAYIKGYRVDKDGRVFSPSGLERKTRIGTRGYRTFGISVKRKTLTISVYRLQAYQKFGSKLFGNGIQVRHLNGRQTDDSRNNIAIGTASENMMDIPESKRLSKAIHAASFIRRFTDEQERKIIAYHKKFRSYKLTMEKFRITSKGSLHYILNKR